MSKVFKTVISLVATTISIAFGTNDIINGIKSIKNH